MYKILDDLPICRMLGIKYPVIQGGMASLGTWELVSAVSNTGGLGIIGCGGSTPEIVKDQIRKTKEHTDKPFGINIMLMSPYLKEYINIIIEEKVNIVTFGGGNPGLHMNTLKDAGIKLIPVVSSVALARRLERLGADAMIAEGLESGGHVGDTSTMALVPQITDSIKIPVIAAGGISDGRGLVAALALGAQGVQMGTRFICSNECIAHPKFKEAIINAQDRATVVTGVTTGHPVRCLENKLTRSFTKLEKEGTSPEVLDKLGRGKLHAGVIEGDIEFGSLMAGQIAGLIKDIRPVKEIIEGIVNEANVIINRLSDK
jgi:enoyl-[acyl-carrier protein] reductase II